MSHICIPDHAGTIEVAEFVDNFKKLYEGSGEEKVQLLYSLHSGGNPRGITVKTMRLFVRSYFAEAERVCRDLRGSLDSVLSTMALSDLANRFTGDRFVVTQRAAVRKTCDSREDNYDYADLLASKDKIAELDVGSRLSVVESTKVGSHTRCGGSAAPPFARGSAAFRG